MLCAIDPVVYFLLVIAIILAWTLFWKAFALWYSARNNDKIWFIIFIIVNILGIPEIIYLYFKTDFFKKLDKKYFRKKK
ncbi:MAG: hypothetical protein JSW73_01675 [Candidatus Woesearchaeota archaeon]|nr:MAG: hypothetical protein JSW73_01675 [Candidatus Woesearchaeota archaeon]